MSDKKLIFAVYKETVDGNEGIKVEAQDLEVLEALMIAQAIVKSIANTTGVPFNEVLDDIKIEEEEGENNG